VILEKDITTTDPQRFKFTAVLPAYPVFLSLFKKHPEWTGCSACWQTL